MHLPTAPGLISDKPEGEEEEEEEEEEENFSAMFFPEESFCIRFNQQKCEEELMQTPGISLLC